MAPRRLRALPAALLLLTVAACGGGDEPAAGPAQPVTELTITSDGLAFDVERFDVRAGEEVTVTYENAHDDVPHNLHVDTGGDDEPQTEVAPGVVTQTLTFTLEEGEYTFLCDVHPAQMRGKVRAVPAPAG